MATISEARALPFFTDLVGSPLESGFVYIGQAGLDPVAYPALVTSDIAGSIVVAQPVRTTHGHAAAAGALIHLFCPIPYSITILDSAGRLVYASLNETDPVAIAQGTASVQSAADLAALRARDKTITNQVWVNGFGMYVYQPTDTTSPENIPFIIVGTDGGRYHLSTQFVSSGWVLANGTANQTSQGAWLSWDTSTSATFLTNNQGSGSGGLILRTVNASNTAELGRATLSAAGTLTTSGGIVATTTVQAGGDITAAGNLFANGNTVNLIAGGSRALRYNIGSGKYELLFGDLLINSSVTMTQATLATNQNGNGVGAVALGNTTSPQPVMPGTWAQTGTAQGGVVLWVRTA